MAPEITFQDKPTCPFSGKGEFNIGADGGGGAIGVALACGNCGKELSPNTLTAVMTKE